MRLLLLLILGAMLAIPPGAVAQPPEGDFALEGHGRYWRVQVLFTPAE